MNTEIRVVRTGEPEVEQVRHLWLEYWSAIGLKPAFQHFAEEIAALPGLYAPPKGRLLLAFVDNQAAGTAALRPFNGSACEAKRLYVRPQVRGAGLGRTLLSKLIEAARAEGYRQMYGDTMPCMQAALALYERFGFRRVAPYSREPTPGAIFLNLAL